MKHTIALSLSLLVFFVLAASACGTAEPTQTTTKPPKVVSPLPSVEATFTSDDLPAVLPTSMATVTQTIFEIRHLFFPQAPIYLADQLIRDCVMGYSLLPGKPVSILKSCDGWSINYLERPMTEDKTTYLPYLDVEMAQLGLDNDWYFLRIKAFEAGLPSDGRPYHYYWEFDMDFDGRGDLLVVVQNLTMDAIEWTVEGVSAWKDANDDVGGASATRSDPGNPGDGYEKQIFSEGAGGDSDLIWARRTTSTSNWIEIAFKKTLLAGDASFAWMAGALQGDFNPKVFDLVDTYTELFQVDNTCALEYNSAPRGLRNGCRMIQPTPTPLPIIPGATSEPVCVKPPKPSDDPCWIWIEEPYGIYECEWVCFN